MLPNMVIDGVLSCVYVQAIGEHLRGERACAIPFGGVVVLLVGNCLQMPQMKSRVLSVDPPKRVVLGPDVDDFPLESPVLEQCKVLKVCVYVNSLLCCTQEECLAALCDMWAHGMAA
jgi:hypothetical protein